MKKRLFRTRRRFVQAVCTVGAIAGMTVGLLGPADAATPPLYVHLPADEGAHGKIVEWWYYVGDLTGTDAAGQTQEYGFEETVFRAAGVAYLGNFALTNLTTGKHYSEGNVSLALGSPLPGGGVNIDADGWTMRGVNGAYQLNATGSNGADAIALRTSSSEPAALEGTNGLLQPYGTVGSSYYYSWTNLHMSGTVSQDGQTVQVSGTGWSDHQWFNPTPLTSLTSLSWDWFAIQLADGRQYMVYLTRNSGGPITNPEANLIEPDGTSVPLDPTRIGDQALGTWTSPASGKTYSSGWLVDVPGGQLTITPKQLDQETNMLGAPPLSGIFPHYWEGVCTVTGTINGQPVTGRTFTEILPKEL